MWQQKFTRNVQCIERFSTKLCKYFHRANCIWMASTDEMRAREKKMNRFLNGQNVYFFFILCHSFWSSSCSFGHIHFILFICFLSFFDFIEVQLHLLGVCAHKYFSSDRMCFAYKIFILKHKKCHEQFSNFVQTNFVDFAFCVQIFQPHDRVCFFVYFFVVSSFVDGHESIFQWRWSQNGNRSFAYTWQSERDRLDAK